MTEPGVGCYAYCVVRAGEQPALEGVPGVDPRSTVGLVSDGDLTALVSAVRLEEFGTEALKRNLENLEWLEQVARAHDAVLARAMKAAAVIPMRLCTIFTDESHVRRMLADRRHELAEVLGHLDGHAEWSVKLLAERQRVQDILRRRPGAEASPADAPGAGHAYFARKKADRLVHERARAIAQEAARHTHERLRGHARAATVLPPQRPELSGRSGEMVLNGAYLVSRTEAEAFAAAVEELRSARRAEGLDLELSGPWAPYNFVPDGRESE